MRDERISLASLCSRFLLQDGPEEDDQPHVEPDVRHDHPGLVHPTDVITVEIWDYDVVGQHDFLGLGPFELASLQQGMEKRS